MPGLLTFGVDEKYKQLRMRKDEQKKLGVAIDKMVRDAEEGGGQPRGCSAGLCGMFSRWRRRGSVRTAAIDLDAAGMATSSTSVDVGFSRAVFGLAGVKRGDPAAKLEEAAAVMRGRIMQLEERAQVERKQAATMQRAGQRSQAIRALKKAKASEAQLEANQSSLLAVEQQVDMLAQAAMQKTLTSALASTSKRMKADGKMLSKAERAIDDASEARDMATDLNGVMAEFAHSGAGDVGEEDLVAELEAMAAADEPPPPPPEQVAASDKATEIARLEAAIAERQVKLDEARAAKESFPVAPDAPIVEAVQTNGKANGKGKRRNEEKAGLLASAAHSLAS